MNTNAIAPKLPSAPPVNDIHGVKPPIDIPNPWFWVWVAVAVIAVIAAVVLLWLWWKNKSKQPPLIPVVPPHERARLKLQEALGLINEPRPFCIFVSDTVRTYLEERFDFHAPERTTEEFLHELAGSPQLLPDQKHSLSEFLSVCDMVKFARYEPGPTELQALHESAVRLVDETEPVADVSSPAPTEGSTP